MRLPEGHTPLEAATDIAISWLRAAYDEKTNDVHNLTNTPAQARELRRAIAKLHNDLLERSKLNGLPLDEKVE